MTTVADPVKREVLRRAKRWERENPSAEGWAWYHVQAYPATLMSLVVEGEISVVKKSNSGKLYRLGIHPCQPVGGA